MSNSLWSHGLQDARLPCPSPSSRVCSISCPLSQWHYPIILSSALPFSTCLQSFPASGSFPISRLFASDGQIIGASASASDLSLNIQGWSPCSPRDFEKSFPTPQFKIINSLGGRNGNTLQYSYLENPMDREAWLVTVHRVTKSWTKQKQLCMHIFCYGPTLTTIYDYWKNHTFDYTDICQKSNVSAF